MISEILNDATWVTLIILPISVLMKNFLGAAKGKQYNNFNKEYLKSGLRKGLFIYAGFLCLSLIAYLSDSILVTINDTDYTLLAGMALITTGAITKYIKDSFEILIEIFGIPTTKEE